MKKIILHNLLYIILIIIFAEIFSLFILVFNYKQNFYNALKTNFPIETYFKVSSFDSKSYDNDYRKPLLSSSNKKPIFIFGCSFAFGDGLNDEENFSGMLHKLTNRSVYNRAEGGIGPQIMLYQFETGKIKELSENCEYIVYVYIPDHLRRHLMFRCWPFLYKVSVRYMLDKKDNLKLQILPHPFQYSNVFKLYESKLPDIYGYEYSEKLFYKILEQSYIKSQNLYPKSKFVILNYSDDEMPFKEKFEKMGIKVISLTELTDKNIFHVDYQLSRFDHHPNAKAWELITPLFIEKVGID